MGVLGQKAKEILLCGSSDGKTTYTAVFCSTANAIDYIPKRIMMCGKDSSGKIRKVKLQGEYKIFC